MLKTILKPFSFLPAILFMVLIFQFSDQPASVSSGLSHKISYKIIQVGDYILDTNLEEWQMDSYADKIDFLTRKAAHMTEYFILALTVAFPLFVYGFRGFSLFLLAFLICVVYAFSDEYHQAFVSGRSSELRDVVIDSLGIFMGDIFAGLIGFALRPFKKNQMKQHKKDSKIKSEIIDDPVFEPIKEDSYVPVFESINDTMNVPVFERINEASDIPVFAPEDNHSYVPVFEPIDSDVAVPVFEPIDSDITVPVFESDATASKPLPYDPDDPFQDWLDDYFPQNQQSDN